MGLFLWSVCLWELRPCSSRTSLIYEINIDVSCELIKINKETTEKSKSYPSKVNGRIQECLNTEFV